MTVGTLEEPVLHHNGSPASGRRQSWGAAGEPAGATKASQTEVRQVQLLLGPASLTSGRGDRTGPAGFQSVFGYN